VARRLSTTEPRRSGVPSTTTGPVIIPGTEKLPFKKIPPRKQFLQRPPSIEEQVAQVLSGPSFPGKQTPKFTQQPMRMPEPVGPMTDMRTMPSMPTTGIASLSDVLPLIDMGGEDIMQLLSGLPKTPSAPVMPISGSQIVDDEPYRDSYRMMEDPEERTARLRREMEENALNTPKLTTDRIPIEEINQNFRDIMQTDPMSIQSKEDLDNLMTGPLFARQRDEIFQKYIQNPINQLWKASQTPMMEEEMVFDGIVRGEPVDPEKWAEAIGVPLTPEQKEMLNQGGFSIEDWNTPIDIIDPRPIPGADPMPPSPETTPVQETGTTPVQGMTMEQMQQMIADMQAQQQEQEQAATREAQEMSKQYMVYGDRTGYNPYLSGQYQSDPYGPSGVPNMGGITTIPVPDGYGIYNPVYGG